MKPYKEVNPGKIYSFGKPLFTADERKVYGALQGMFNAKPDLAITINNYLLVFEAKLTLKFNDEQIKRTKNIAQVWAKLLYEDMEFKKEPEFTVLKLGAAKLKEIHASIYLIYELY